jgi:hypothetical protein
MVILVARICKSTILHLKAAIRVETAPLAMEASKGKDALAVTVAMAAMEAMEAMAAMEAMEAMAVMVAMATGGAGVHIANYVEIGVMRQSTAAIVLTPIIVRTTIVLEIRPRQAPTTTTTTRIHHGTWILEPQII